MDKRGIMYVVWGEAHVSSDLAYRSCMSAKSHKLPTVLLTDNKTPVEEGYFDDIIRIDFPEDLPNLSRKSLMFEYSPFEETLFLDDDTVILDELNFGFEMSEAHGLAVAYSPCFHLWANGKEIERDMIYYNTGVIFFNNQHQSVKDLMNRWKQIASENRISNDQPAFCSAVYQEKFNPFVLPHTWNFRGQFGKPLWIHGPLKIWHSRRPIPINIDDWNNFRHTGFGRVQATGRGAQEIIYRRLWLCPRCGESKRSPTDMRPYCQACETDPDFPGTEMELLTEIDAAEADRIKDPNIRLKWWAQLHNAP